MSSYNYHSFLPQTLLDKFQKDGSLSKSIIIAREFEDYRVHVTKRGNPNGFPIDAPMNFQSGSGNPFPSFDLPGILHPSYHRICANRDRYGDDSLKTFLHLAVTTCDVPLAHEIIRMGITQPEIRSTDNALPITVSGWRNTAVPVRCHRCVTEP